jgi:Ca-activated chloride channel homolog
MSFGAMAPWQALLLVAAALGAAAWLFYIKVRPPRVAVPSLALWRRVLDEKRELTWWERVRKAVSLAVTVLIAGLLALAVTRPGPKVAAGTRGRLLIVLDSSWSMLARTSTGETRWDRALRQARALAASAGGDEVALATTAAGLVEGPTSDLALIETAIGQLVPLGGERDAWPRVAGADAVHFITDGAVDRAVDSGVTMHSVYEVGSNVGIVAFEVRPPTAAGAAAQAYIEIGNYSPEGQRVRYTITRGTQVVLDASVDLAAGEVGRQIVPLEASGDARLRARISAERNALAIDDEFVAWMHGTEPLQVLVVSESPGPLALLLRGDPSLTPTFLTPGTYRPHNADVVIFDRWLPPTPVSKPALIIAPPSGGWLGTAGPEESAPRWIAAGDHPVLRGLDPLTLDIKRVRTFGDPALVPVARSARGTPLISVVDAPARRAVVLGFAFGDSNLTFARAFPVLIGNTIDWLARPALGVRQPGPVVLPASTTRVTTPDGDQAALVQAGDHALATLDQPGVYLVEAGGSRGVITVNVGNPEVSNLTRTHLSPGVAAESAAGGSGRSWWVYGVALAFVLALIEWVTWQRRITV